MRTWILRCLPAAAAAFLLLPAQDPPPLAPGVVARLDGEDITLTAYQDFLWRQTGKRAVSQMADEILLEKAARRFGLTLDEAAADAAAADRLAQAAQGRPTAEFEAEMRSRGYDPEMLRALFRAEALRVQRLDGIARATRSATDARIAAAFEAEFGPGGVQVEIAHLLFMPHVMRADRIRAGADPKSLDAEGLKQEARELAERARARAAAGEDFAALATELSHDQVSKKDGGRIANYRPGLYGPAFTDAIAALQPGECSAVIETGAGFHVVLLRSRTMTRLEEVQADLVQRILAAEPDWQEREEILNALRGKSNLQLW